MFSDNTVQWIGTLDHDKKVSLYCWMASFGIVVKDSWSERNANAYVNSEKRHKDDYDLDGYVEEVNALGKGKHMDKEVAALLTDTITKIYQSGLTDSRAIYEKLLQENNLPSVNGVPITDRTVIRYVRKVREASGFKKGRPVHLDIKEEYERGTTSIQAICDKTGRSFSTVYHALAKHGYLERQRKGKFK